MPRLPSVTAKEIVKALEHAGFQFERQKGSHITLRHPVTMRTIGALPSPAQVPKPLSQVSLPRRPAVQKMTPRDVAYWGQSGKHMLFASISPFDPKRSFGSGTKSANEGYPKS